MPHLQPLGRRNDTILREYAGRRAENVCRWSVLEQYRTASESQMASGCGQRWTLHVPFTGEPKPTARSTGYAESFRLTGVSRGART